MTKKAWIAVIAMALVACLAVGGTIAYLKTSKTVTNVFVSGKVDINVEEGGDGEALPDGSGRKYKVVAGEKYAKSPKITVKKGSEDCFLFVEVVKSDNFEENFEEIVVADGWTREVRLGETTELYWRRVATADVKDNDVTYKFLKGEGDGKLKDGYVQVKTTFDGFETEDGASLGFNFGAIQAEGFTGEYAEAAAWSALTDGAGTLVPQTDSRVPA